MGSPASFVADAPSTPASFQADEPQARSRPSDPLDKNPKTAAELPSRADFEASHQAAVKSWWDRAKAAASTVETMGEAGGRLLMKGLDLPVVNASDVAGAVSGALGFGEKAGRGLVSGPPQTTAGGVATGAAKVVSGMTSARNLGMAALMGPFGKIAPLLTRAVGAGFSLSMLKHVYDQEPAIQDAITKKDWPRAAEGIAEAAGTAGLAVLGAGVGLRRGGEPVEGPSPVSRATASVEEGMKALGPASFVPDEPQATAPPAPSQTMPPSTTEGAVPIHAPSQTMPPSTTEGAVPIHAPSQTMPPSTTEGAVPIQQVGAATVDDATAATSPFTASNEEPKGVVAAPGTFTGARTTGNEIPEGVGGQYGAGFGIYQVPMSNVVGREDIGGMPDKMADARRYADMIRAGSPPPPLFGSLGDGGTVQVQGARRLEALRQTGATSVPVALMNDWKAPAAPPSFVNDTSSGPQMSAEVQPLAPEQQAEPEKRAVTPTLEQARVPSTPPAYGGEVNVKVPGEATLYPARYAVRELADVQPSHNPFTFAANHAFDYTNDRDYDRPQNKARVIKNASPGTYDPDYTTTPSPTAEHGPPVVDLSGNVLGGNSRSMSQALVYMHQGPDAALYKQAIETKAAQFGIDPADLARFKKPILVREVGPGVDAQNAITDFNKAAPADLAPEEQAVSDGRRLSPGTVTELAARLGDVGEDGSLADALRGDNGADIVDYLVRDGVLTAQEKGGYLDDRGFLTPEIKARVAKALVGRLFDSPSEYRATTPSMRGKLERVAPQVLRTETRPEWAITDRLREALALTEDARARRNSLDRHLKQTASAGARTYSPEAVDIARTLEESPVKAGAAFRRYANDEALSREGNQTAFFKPPTRMEAFQDAFGGGGVVSASVAPELSERGGYVVGAGLGTHAALARFERVELDPEEAKAAHAYVTNPSGVELVHRILGNSPPDEAGLHVGGFHISAGDMWEVFNRLTTARTKGEIPGIAPGLGQLIRAIKGAAEESRGLVGVSDFEGKSPASRQRALDEEIGHAMQSQLNYGAGLTGHGIGARSGYLPGERDAFLSDPVARRAFENLASRSQFYARAPDGVKMAEVGVRLMNAGRFEELGLDWNQARSLAARYIRALRQAYGSQTPRDIARRINRAFGSPAKGGATEHGALPEGARPAGRERLAGGAGPDLSGGGPEIAHSARDAESDTPSLFNADETERVGEEAALDRDRLQGERLTAQFDSPLSREEQLRKLKPGEQPQQTGFFEATPEKPQFSLFGDEKGGISPDLLSLGAGKFITEDVIPTAKRIATDLVEAKDQAARIVAPQTRGAMAEYTGLRLRQRMAQFARRFDQGEQRLRDARRFFNRRAQQDNYDFIDQVERGLGRLATRRLPPADAALEPIAKIFARMLDQRRAEVQALGEGALEHYYTNYFPHIFERPERAAEFMQSFFSGKRSMEGPKSFLKHREFPTFREALDAGLKAVSDNPVDLVLLKAREMDRYLLAHHVLRDLAEKGIAKRVTGQGDETITGQWKLKPSWEVKSQADIPANFISIRDPVGGGRWYAEQGAADVLNNFLSVGLRARSGAARILLGLNNTMNQANLSLSGFHLLAETVSSMAGRAGLGFVQAMEGHPLDAALHILTSPAAPFLDLIRGSAMHREWFKPGSEGAPIAAMIDAFTKAGGRARQGAEYTNNAVASMTKAFRRGNFIGAAIRSPFAAIEAMSHPMFEWMVPRMKMGAFLDIAQYELEKLGPGAKVEDVQRSMAEAWDHVENRLGQMTYDNLFLNRTFKDVLHLMVRSVGWNLGTLREAYTAGRAITGAVRGAGSTLMKEGPEGWSRGSRFEQLKDNLAGVDKHGLGFVLGYALIAAAMGALYTYLHTGKGPRELRDYFFPKRADGRRVVVAPYIKDAYGWARDPAGTALNKSGPVPSTLATMVRNKDYYDRPVRNLDDPYMKQLAQDGEFALRQMMPFTVQEQTGPQSKNSKRESAYRAGHPERQAEHFLGVNPAPAALQPGYQAHKDVRHP